MASGDKDQERPGQEQAGSAEEANVPKQPETTVGSEMAAEEEKPDLRAPVASLRDSEFEETIDDIDMDDGDDIFDFDEPMPLKGKRRGRGRSGGGGGGKLLGPLLVLTLAAGAGGYIVMNPQMVSSLLGGGANTPSPMTPVATESAPFNMADVGLPPVPEPVTAPIAPDPTPVVPAPVEQNIHEPLATPAFDPLPMDEDTAISALDTEMPQPSSVDNVPRSPDGFGGGEVTGQDVEAILSASETGKTDSNAGFGEDEGSDSLDEFRMGDITPPEDMGINNLQITALYGVSVPDMPESPDMLDTDVQLAEMDMPEFPEMPSSIANEPAVLPDNQPETGDNSYPGIGGVPEVPQQDEKPPVIEEADNIAPLMQEPVSTAKSTANNKAAPRPVSNTDAGPDVYYDSTLNIPKRQSTSLGPRKVNPKLEPASRYVVVEETHKPSDIESMLVSANRAMKLGRYESALEMYNSLYDRNPRDPRIIMGRAVTQQSLGLNDSAIQSYEMLLSIDPDNADALTNML